MNTTTEHLKALLVDDGREFAMARKADLKALIAMLEVGESIDSYLDYVGAQNNLIVERKKESDINANAMRHALKHGEERRRYMANNKALLARVEQLEAWNAESERLSLAGIAQSFKDQKVIRAVASAIRKAPATCRMLGLTK